MDNHYASLKYLCAVNNKNDTKRRNEELSKLRKILRRISMNKCRTVLNWRTHCNARATPPGFTPEGYVDMGTEFDDDDMSIRSADSHFYFKQIMNFIDTEIDEINDDMLKTHDILIYNPIFITGCECKRHKSFY